ncbi:fructose-bisphosphate aldolase [Sulfurifustis variabilis]|uniref:Probable fructose-bisphosphate aldolase class 1 n=1 Tax=Sulfurifustis variabilis TaxID=1675686 RepID=A0A1B4VGP1_9GAMM|nr:class I fructose-bisphosphate aldolase [Sulfurifustis variabilis]BAU50017.1 fructose-bisphosphate aldolase [Sulfurifustis variabilis]
MNIAELQATARAMVARGKGLLAMDESSPTIAKRFKKVGIEDTVDNRRTYRELLVSTPGLGSFISGAILYDETIRQSTSDGTPFPKYMADRGIIPGIKVDKGAKNLAGFPGEKVTEGLDALRERLIEYKGMGARFAKWRAVITIGPDIPTPTCIDSNAHALARYAALCQEASLVPIVEPEVLIDGSHTLERCYDVSLQTLRAVFRELAGHRVAFEGMVLKASMVISGLEAPKRAGVEEVADATLRCLLNTVPATVAGVAFLSGGQGNEEATAHLNAMNARHKNLPWPLTFSYSRALQQPVMEHWRANPANAAAAQKLLYHRARMNGAAATGSYNVQMEREAA